MQDARWLLPTAHATAETMRVLNICLLLLVMASCRTLNPSVMFKEPKSYPYAVDTAAPKEKEYVIAPKDKVEMHLYTLEGFRLVDVTASAIGGAGSEQL